MTLPPKCVVPLFLSQSSSTFIQWGTAILYEYEGRPFLVTAAHVVDGSGDNTDLLMLSNHAHLVESPDEWQITKIPAGMMRKDDKMDLAVAILENDAASAFLQLGFGFLGQSTMDPREITRLDHLVYVGFPGNHQSCVHFEEGSFVHLRPAAFHTKRVSNAEAEGLELSVDHHIVSEFNVSRLKPLPDQQPSAPMPPGMSGGAVFRYEAGAPSGFVGIIHRWYDPGYLVATRSYALIQMLDAAIAKRG